MRFILCLILLGCSSFVFGSNPDIETALMDKDYASVKEQAAKVLRYSNNSAERIEAEYYLGLAHVRLGQYSDARKAFQIVMAADTDEDVYDKAALGMIEALSLSGFYKDALKEAEKLLKKSPKSHQLSLIYLKLARANLKMMRWSKANEYLEKIINEFPQSPEAQSAKLLQEEKDYFTVQVGSFVDQAHAVALSNQLKAQGHYSYIVETSTEGKTFYRVRVGQSTSLKDAQQLETQLSQLGYPTLIYP